MNQATPILLLCVVHVTLFAAMASVVYLVARRLQAKAGAAAAAASLAMVLVLTLLAASPWPRWNLAARSSATSAHQAATDTNRSDTTDDSTIGTANELVPALATDEPSQLTLFWDSFSQAIAQPADSTNARETSAHAFSLRSFAWMLAAVCLAVGTLRFAWGVWAVRGLVRRSRSINAPETPATLLLEKLCTEIELPTPIALHESSEVATPATVGWWRPVILLPPAWHDWTPTELKAVLSHELAHVAGRDYLSWLVARLAVAVHFYHPLVHWLASRLQLEQELAADALAVRLVGDRTQYLQTLAALALATPHHHIAGPARTLIPNRSLLMRRVEMLRTTKHQDGTAGRLGFSRLAATGLLVLVAVGVSGLRQAATGQDSAVAPDHTATLFSELTPASSPIDRIGIEVMPPDTIYAVSVRPAEVFSQPGFEDLAKQVNEVARPLAKSGLKISNVAEVMVITYGTPQSQPRIVVRFTTENSADTLTALYLEDMGIEANNSNTTWENQSERLTRLDSNTLVLDYKPNTKSENGTLPPVVLRPLAWAKEWQKASDEQVVAVFDLEAFRRNVSDEEQKILVGGFPMQMVAPALEHTKWCVASAGIHDNLHLNLLAECDNDKNATVVAGTAKALLTLFGNIVEQQRSVVMEQANKSNKSPETAMHQSSINSLFDLAAEFTSNANPTADGNRVSLSFTSKAAGAEQVAITTGLLLPGVQAAREAARRTQSINNLKNLGLAMHNYHDTYGHFPPAVLYTEAVDGTKVGHSWRVALLPFMEQQALYAMYKKDEPWDSENNKKVLAAVPPVFHSPSDTSAATNTSYFALVGKETMFDGDEGVEMREITDGTSNTFMLVDAKREIPWTKPEDIPYSANKPLPKLGGIHPKVFLASYVDGSVHTMANSINETVLRYLINKADNQPTPRPAEFGRVE